MVNLPRICKADDILRNPNLENPARLLGHVVIVWGIVEEAVRDALRDVALINEPDKHIEQALLAATPFRSQIDLLRKTAHVRRPNSDWFKTLHETLLSVEGKLHNKRNRFIHDPWIENEQGKIVRTERGKGELSIPERNGKREIKLEAPVEATVDEVKEFLDAAYNCHQTLDHLRWDYLTWMHENDGLPAYLTEQYH